MIKILKSLSAIILLLCLFLPLSQCSQEARPGQTGVDTKVIIYTPLQESLQYKLSWKTLAPALLFILPFGLVLIQLLRDDITSNMSGAAAPFTWFLYFLEVCSLTGLTLMLLFHAFLAMPLVGFYIAAAATFTYFLSLLLSLLTRNQ